VFLAITYSIYEILLDIDQEDNDFLTDFEVPELQHSLGSMETRNIDLWDYIFRDDAWRSMTPIVKAHGYEATCPSGIMRKAPKVVAFHMLEHLHTIYKDWSFACAGWTLFIPNRLLSDVSFILETLHLGHKETSMAKVFT